MEFLKPVIEKLGIGSEELAKLEKGELSADDFVTSYIHKSEQAITERIKATVESESKSELQRGAYARAEKLLAETFGVDIAKYEGVDNQKRLSTIITDLKTQREQAIKDLEKQYSTADAQKLQQLTQQLEQANNALTEREKTIEQVKLEGETKLSAYIREQQITKMRDTLIEGVKNPRFEADIMRAVFDVEVAKAGYNFELDSEGKIWVNKDGKRVQNPKRLTENLTYDMLFNQISEAKTFTKQSNGSGEKSDFLIDEKDKNNPIRLKRLQSLQENNHLE